MSTEAKPRGPGRPPGSPNKDYLVTQSRLPFCKKCGSTNLLRIKKVYERKYNGIEPDGFRYNLVVWSNSKCQNCGQANRIREAQFHPEEAGYEEPIAEDEEAG